MIKQYSFVLMAVFVAMFAIPALRAQSNCYVRLTDASGYTPAAEQIAALEQAAAALCLAFDSTGFGGQFKVYDFGFYLHHEATEGGYPEPFARKVEEVAALSPYYLLFGKQSDRSGVYTRFWVIVNLPDEGQFSCFGNSNRVLLNSQLNVFANEKYHELEKSPLLFSDIEESVIHLLKNEIVKSINCCIVNNRGEENCEQCPSDDQILSYFINEGFQEEYFEQVVITQNSQGFINNGVYTSANINFVNNGYDINVSEEINLLIDSIFYGYNVVAIVTNDDLFCEEDFNEIMAIWQDDALNADFKIWIHGFTFENQKKIFYKVKENLLDTYTGPYPIINGWIKEPSFTRDNFNMNTIASNVKGIYSKNTIGSGINIILGDNESLTSKDLWITIINNPIPRYFQYGLTNYNKSTFVISKNYQVDNNTYHDTYVNYYKLNGETYSTGKPMSYKLAYIVAHEFLHQLLIQGYNHIVHCTQLFQDSKIKHENYFGYDGNSKTHHFPLLRAHLNADANLVFKLLPDYYPSSTNEYEQIAPWQEKMLRGYFLLLRLDDDESKWTKKILADTFKKRIDEYYKE